LQNQEGNKKNIKKMKNGKNEKMKTNFISAFLSAGKRKGGGKKTVCKGRRIAVDCRLVYFFTSFIYF